MQRQSNLPAYYYYCYYLLSLLTTYRSTHYSPSPSIPQPCVAAMAFDLFRLLVVEAGQLVAGGGVDVQEFVELGVQRLRVTVLGALDDRAS